MVYLLVYGAFLVIIGITATAQAVMASAHFSASVMNAVIAADRSIIGAFVQSQLLPEDIDADGPDPVRRAALEEGVRNLLEISAIQDSRIAHVELRRVDGLVLAADRPSRVGMTPDPDRGFRAAASGGTFADLADEPTRAAFGEGLPENVIAEYLPILDQQAEVMAVLAIARDADDIVARLDQSRTDIVLLTIAAAGVVAVLLFFIFRAAQTRITRQTEQLVEAARRDSLTGLLNHGSISELLNTTVADAGGSRVGIALIDIDNFTLLNQTHGHRAGDDVLHRFATMLDEHFGEPYAVGRFGPDEFLVVAPPLVVNALERGVERLRTDLNELSLQFGAEQMPITVSAGLAVHPDHAPSVTDLVSTVALTLNEAKSSGGDQVRMTDRTANERADARGFDVLRGLVIAVDTKDRYTKRHSEDVARYATFIARRLDLGEQFESTIRLAGLLHDVGKIGIPDQILRKPGQLTADEAEIVKQHVALGDAIVRDLPNIEAIRAGIRHHHERWDGTGYLDGLADEQIPLIARILSVADVFSAMTTTRPYRKALPLTEALKRLGDAAGSQLDEELVTIFIAGIETAPDAPLPGENVPHAHLWVPLGARAQP
jgi:diguanylate cyclase (GGDEF)-like protein